MRYLIKFTKDSDIKFISHLDLMRTIQRIIRRAELPIDYSQGFNPHMNLSIAQPLSVGTYSEGEYMDIVLKEELQENEVKNKMNSYAPRGIRVLEVVKIPQNKENEKKIPQGMALIDAASYLIKIKYDDIHVVEEAMKELLKKETFEITKKSKSGEKLVDIKPLIKSFKFWTKEDYLIISTLISCGSREHLSPDLLCQYIINNVEGYKENSFIEIRREEMYAYKNHNLVPLYKYI